MTTKIPDGRKTLREQKKEETRRQLSLAAVSLLTTEGDDRTTVAAIAERAGVSPRTFHNYFARREEAFFHFIETILDEWQAEFLAAPRDEPPVCTFRRVFLHTVEGQAALSADVGGPGSGAQPFGDGDGPSDGIPPYQLMGLGDHIAVALGPEDKERAKDLFRTLADLIHRRSDGALSPFRARVLLATCLAAAGATLETFVLEHADAASAGAAGGAAGAAADGAADAPDATGPRSFTDLLDEALEIVAHGV
ncbi:TetR/AcrR family transcriptional regulator [Corynebacterium bovis]|uniref:TetR/AcrR family transcriptional regulator n=1 Tax=Corynebacterium bovis TaxID=36808 RepID=UPI001C892C0A|nr:TetR/AcrR family transcriptional regulator [Corynebacterium bovis]MDN8579294.1 TetR/AcrR family transcriptional regulator [Corynebacterium bovis]